MKSIKILLSVILIASICGCSDFLDKNPLVNPAAETYYQTEQDCFDAIMGLYSFSQRETFYLAPWLIIGDGASDDCVLGNEVSDGYSWLGPRARPLIEFEILPTSDQISGCWNQCFSGVSFATVAIERIGENMNIPEATKNIFLGEAYFLRAFYYFSMVRMYGRLQIVDHVLSYDEYFMPRASIEETWAFIESDCKMAASLLPERKDYPEGQTGRATKGAANSLLGKSYIYQGKFQDAYNILTTVVASGQYGLLPVYEHVFDLDHQNSEESVYAIQHASTDTGWSDDNEGNILSFYSHDWDPDDDIKWHNGWAMHCPTQDLLDSYEPGDPRLAATIIFPGEFFDGRINPNYASSTGYLVKKWYIPWGQRSNDQSDCQKNIIFIRYADVLLYLAEAANEIGRTSEALDYLEQVRARARSNSDDPNVLPRRTETDRNALRDLIWHERRVELACEWQRFYDLVRQGRAGQVLRAYWEKYSATHPLYPNKGRYFVDGRNEIFPIPNAQILASDGTLEQNPGY